MGIFSEIQQEVIGTLCCLSLNLLIPVTGLNLVCNLSLLHAHGCCRAPISSFCPAFVQGKPVVSHKTKTKTLKHPSSEMLCCSITSGHSQGSGIQHLCWLFSTDLLSGIIGCFSAAYWVRFHELCSVTN